VLTVLHAGGKFGGSGYKVSGGLHGVGISVVNALSSKLLLEIDRGGNHFEMSFEDGGRPTGPLKQVGPARQGRTGTTVTFWPDASIFDEVEFRAQTIERLQMMAFLQRGLEIRFVDERPDHEQKVVFRYTGGIEDFVRHLNESKEPLFKKVAYFEQAEETQEVEVALQWNSGYYESLHSFANGIATTEGGMHEEGLRKALTNVVNRYARTRNVLRNPTPISRVATFARDSQDPFGTATRTQFEGQTKAKLGNVSIRSLVERTTNEKLAEWIDENPKEANQILQKALLAQRARARRAPRQRPHSTQVST